MSIEETLKIKIKDSLKSEGLDLELNEIIIENSKTPEHGDYASNVALKFAGRLGMKPRDLAEKISNSIDKEVIEKIEIAGPGFINFFVKKDAINSVVKSIIAAGDSYGKGEKKNKKVNVEFVSANPTGDLHLGHARCAAVGDSICRLYDFAGYEVTREFYVNNAGNQIHTLGLSLDIRLRQLLGENIALPEDSYHANDIINIAKAYNEKYPNYKVGDEESFKKLQKFGMDEELEKIKDIYNKLTSPQLDNLTSIQSQVYYLLPDEAMDTLAIKNYLNEVAFNSLSFANTKSILKSLEKKGYLETEINEKDIAFWKKIDKS